jgi:hypothetical protein
MMSGGRKSLTGLPGGVKGRRKSTMLSTKNNLKGSKIEVGKSLGDKSMSKSSKMEISKERINERQKMRKDDINKEKNILIRPAKRPSSLTVNTKMSKKPSGMLSNISQKQKPHQYVEEERLYLEQEHFECETEGHDAESVQSKRYISIYKHKHK